LSLALAFSIHNKQKNVDPSDLTFSFSSHRHSYISLDLGLTLSFHDEQQVDCSSFTRSTPVIRGVPYTSVTCLLCVSNHVTVKLPLTRPYPPCPYPTRSHIDTHRSILHRNTPHPLTDSVTRLIYLRVYDSRVSSSQLTPSPSSLSYSLTHTHRSIGYHNMLQPLTTQHIHPHDPHTHDAHLHVHSGPLVSCTSDQDLRFRCDHVSRGIPTPIYMYSLWSSSTQSYQVPEGMYSPWITTMSSGHDVSKYELDTSGLPRVYVSPQQPWKN
jgi:hypothetical protein